MESIKILSDSHISARQKPKNLQNADLALFKDSFFVKINKTTIHQIFNANILKNTICDLHNFKFYPSYSHIPGFKEKSLLKKIILFFKPLNKIDKGIWITDEWSAEYFHWLTDALTRLIAVEDFGNNYRVILPNEYNQREYIKRSLELLNFPIYYYNKRRRLKVKELIIPSHTAHTGNYNKQLINKLRGKFIKENEIIPNRKIYISRQKAKKRKVLNENDVVDLLIYYNYEIHYFEDYNFEKQIEIMSQTKTLIGLHGAGLTNMLFMKTGGQILEFRKSNDSHNNCYFSLASDLKHDYYYLIGNKTFENLDSTDITLDIQMLRETIKQMEINS
jgi:capsular polysaccharide biosynthesis protein